MDDGYLARPELHFVGGPLDGVKANPEFFQRSYQFPKIVNGELRIATYSLDRLQGDTLYYVFDREHVGARQKTLPQD